MIRWSVCWLLCLAVPAWAQPADSEQERAQRWRAMQENVADLLGAFAQLGPWDEHYTYFMDALETFYERNEWNSEPDQFALDLTAQVEAVPPWNVQQRFDLLIGALSDRYLLDDRQEKLLRNTVAQLSNELFMKHSGRIANYALDMVQTRVSGEPITADRVAAWVGEAGPVLDDVRQQLLVEAGRLMNDLDPEQQALWKADLDAAQRRFQRLDELKQKWAAGKWTEEDWGLERDPLQLAALERKGIRKPGTFSEASPGSDDAAPRPAGGAAAPTDRRATGGQPPGKEADADPWAQYVRSFVSKYALNADQQQRAWSFYHDLTPRRDRVQKRYSSQIESLRRRLGAKAEQSPAIREQQQHQSDAVAKVFDQLRSRLDKLPTRAQRRAAEPAASQPAKPAASQPAKP